MPSTDDPALADSDELAIFIDSQGNYRILVPNDWSRDPQRRMPEFAYLAVASVLRLAKRDEVEFIKSMTTWARETLARSEDIEGPKPRPSHH